MLACGTWSGCGTQLRALPQSPKCPTSAEADRRVRGLQVCIPARQQSCSASPVSACAHVGAESCTSTALLTSGSMAVAHLRLCGCRCAAQGGSRAPSMRSLREPSRRRRPLAWESGARSARVPHDAADMSWVAGAALAAGLRGVA